MWKIHRATCIYGVICAFEHIDNKFEQKLWMSYYLQAIYTRQN